MRNKLKRNDIDQHIDQDKTKTPAEAEAQTRAEMAEARRKREQWEREHANDARELEESRRELFTAFKMWAVCPEKVCARAKACRGNVLECLRVRWREHVPDEMRALLSKSIDLYRQGMPWPEAVTTAYNDMEKHAAAMDEYAARRAAEAASPPAAQPPAAEPSAPANPGPRIRTIS
jgi:hypothetical protein